MAKARLLYRSRVVYPDGAIREMVIWRLPFSADEKQQRLKYSLYYGDANSNRLVLYDNEKGKGDHRHHYDKEESYHFIDVETLISDFQKDIDNIRGNK